MASFEVKASANGLDWAPWGFGMRLACVTSAGNLHTIWKEGSKWEHVEFDCEDNVLNAVNWGPANNVNNFLYPKNNDKVKQMLVTGGCKGDLTIWEIYKDGGTLCHNKVYTIEKCHSNWIRDVSWSSNSFLGGYIIATASEDRSFKIFEIERKGETWSHEEKVMINLASPVWRVKWNYSGNLLAVGSTSNEGVNLVQVYHEDNSGEWKVLHDLKKPD